MTVQEQDLELYMQMKDNGYVEQHDYEDYFNNDPLQFYEELSEDESF